MLINDDGILIDEELQEYFEKGDFSDLKITPVYLPYSYWRCKKLLFEYYGIDMITRTGYKLDRYRGHRTYRLVWVDNGEVLNECMSLKEIQYFIVNLKHPPYPLHDDTPKQAKLKAQRRATRNQGAERFLEIIKNIKPPSDDENKEV